jgi:DNA excision repair protein ERCC-3
MSSFVPENPLIVQGDHTILVEVGSPRYEQAREALVRFAELIKSPEHIHTYRLTPLSIWNACAAGVSPDTVVSALHEYAKYPVPEHVSAEVWEYASRYGRLRLTQDEGDLLLTAADPLLAMEVANAKQVAPLIDQQLGPCAFRIRPTERGKLKLALVKLGYPAHDLAGYTPGVPLPVSLRTETATGSPFRLRPYQTDAARAFYAGGAPEGGSGVIVLPCGAGKTIVGLATLAELQTSTLILTTGVTAAHQWIAEILDKTSLQENQIGEYTGACKEIRPITVATYQILTWRPAKDGGFPHLTLFDEHEWGLIVYDEVHLLPAPVFQVTAGLQARRRLGLTATLVREDGREDDVFALIGPKKADMPWKQLESQGWIAKAICNEIRLPLPEDMQMHYALSPARRKFRVAAENPDKTAVVRRLLRHHAGEPALVIGMYVDQLKDLAGELGVPVLTGSTRQAKREDLFRDFRSGKLPVLVVSKVANFAIDLPDAGVAIQVSGTFGSRQEEAQRLGRILRPKPGANQAYFYSIVSHDTVEQDFAMKRQLFLCEQGYTYRICELRNSNDEELFQ